MPEVIKQNDLFACAHLGASDLDEKDIMQFTVKYPTGQGLVRYIQLRAFSDEDRGIMRTYIVRDRRSNELVAYFSLKAGLISLNEGIENDEVIFDTLPGVEIANFAVNNTYMKKHSGLKGVGKVIFTDFIVPVIQEVSANIGIRLIYIFALPVPDLIDRYDKYGFVRLDLKSEEELHRRLKPKYDSNCIFMYQLL